MKKQEYISKYKGKLIVQEKWETWFLLIILLILFIITFFPFSLLSLPIYLLTKKIHFSSLLQT